MLSRKHAKPRSRLITALDVGTSKVCCFVAKPDANSQPRIIGVGHHASEGLRNGVIVDIEAAEGAILDAVHAAEKMAGDTVRCATVSLSGGRPSSYTVGAEVPISGHEVAEGDLRRILDQTLCANGTGERDLIHSIPIGFAIDGERGIRDPRGMYGQKLGVQMHMITASSGTVRTLKTIVERCHLDVEGFVVSPYASGLACLIEDEMDLGVTVVDMGGGTTSLAVFYDGAVVFADAIPVGGTHVTNDIARGLSTPVAYAERLKTLHGSVLAGGLADEDTLDVPLIGDENEVPHNAQTTKARLNRIIRARLEETLELVRARLEASGVEPLAGNRLVLTGGASQLQGVRELAAEILQKQVRMGRPLRLRGLAEAVSGPAFAACAGMISFSIQNPAALPAITQPFWKEEPGWITGRLGQWLRAHL